jgi:hypothetical protein
MKYLSVSAAVAALLITAPVAAQQVTAANPQTIIDAMQAEGYQAKLGADKEGDPMVSSKSSGSSFDIYFYGCEKNSNCTSIQFVSFYEMSDHDRPSLEKLNDWNSKERFASASLDSDKDPWLRMDVYTGPGGISMATFRGNLDLWTSQMADFEKLIGLPGASDSTT